MTYTFAENSIKQEQNTTKNSSCWEYSRSNSHKQIYFNQSNKIRKSKWGGSGINTQGKVKPHKKKKIGWNHKVVKINFFKGPKFIMKVKVAQSCLTLCDPMDYTCHGILQARILEGLAFPFSRGSSQPKDPTQVSRIVGGFFTSWATREAQKYWSGQPIPSPADLPDPGIKLGSPALQADSYPLSYQGSPISGGLCFVFFGCTALKCGRPGLDPWVGKIPWRRERLPTPVFRPGELHGLYSPWGCKELDATEWLSLHSRGESTGRGPCLM